MFAIGPGALEAMACVKASSLVTRLAFSGSSCNAPTVAKRSATLYGANSAASSLNDVAFSPDEKFDPSWCDASRADFLFFLTNASSFLRFECSRFCNCESTKLQQDPTEFNKQAANDS